MTLKQTKHTSLDGKLNLLGGCKHCWADGSLELAKKSQVAIIQVAIIHAELGGPFNVIMTLGTTHIKRLNVNV